MKYGFALGLIFGLLLVGSGYGQETAVLPAPAFDVSAKAERPALTAKLASYFPGIGDSSEVTLASCEADCCGEDCLGGACGSCGDVGCCGDCCGYGIRIWGEFLYLDVTDAEVAFADPINGPITGPPANNPIPVGPVAVLDPDYSPGFAAGFAFDLSPCSSLGAEFTHFESQTFMDTSIAAPLVLRSMVSHPLSASATTDFLQASGYLDIDFDLIDIDFRHMLIDSCDHQINYLLGVRYGHLDQALRTRFVDNGVEDVLAEVGFDGGGIRFGLEGEKHSCKTGVLVYAKAIASLVTGDFNAKYMQRESTDGIVVDTSWKAGRVVTMGDLELGTGWQSCNGLIRLTAGYRFSKWFNTVMLDEYINAVQTNEYAGLGDNMTFDGLVTRAEIRF